MSSSRASWITAAFIAVLAVALFANSHSNGLTADDVAAISDPTARHPLDWRTILLRPSRAPGGEATSYRPFTTWTFAVDHALHGDRPFGYHLANALGHAGVAAIVVLLVQALGLSLATAGLAGALFAVHPIHSEAVAAVAGRSVIFAAGFALLALLWQRRAAQGSRAALPTAAAAGAYALALLADEQAIGLLILLPLAELIPLDGAPGAQQRARRALLGLAVAGITLGYLGLRRAALGHVIPPADTIAFDANPIASAAPALRILTGLQVLAHAVWVLLVPVRLATDYSYAQVPAVASVSEIGAILGILTAGAVLALAVIVRRYPVALFWYALALATYVPVSNLLFPIDTIFREQFLYLPSAGFCALLAMVLFRPTTGWRRAATTIVAVLLVLGWGAGTRRRNFIWHDEASLAESMVASAPGSARAHTALGAVYTGNGREEDAVREFAKALSIYPKDTNALYNLGVIQQQHGKPLEAMTLFRRVVDINPGFFPAWINFAAVNNSQGMFTPALDAAERAITVRPDVPNGHVVRGLALRGLERLDEARGAFEQALRLAPEHPDALLGLAIIAVDRGEFDEAARTFERLLPAVPSPDVYRGLVYSYRMAGHHEEAARVAASARERFPDDAFFAPEAGDQDHR